MSGTILLDLDGTIIDPRIGIIGCYRYALSQIGFEPDPADDLLWVIGPPLRRSFARLFDGRHDLEQAVSLYRERYSQTGIYEADVYPGVVEAMAALKDAGFRLLLCTAKARIYAERIAQHFGFERFLDGIYGAELDGRFDDKGELIAHILQTHDLDPRRTIMVGDRDNDVLSSRRNGVDSIGVLWGYGSEAELTDAGANRLIWSPDDLLDACTILLGAR